MQVSEMMNRHVVTISPDETAELAARLLSRNNVGSLPVCGSDGKLRGMVTDRDIVLRCVAAENDPGTTPVREIMSRGIVTVTPEEDVKEAARLMAHEQLRRLPVVREGQVVGMVTLADIARSNRYDMEASRALSEISTNLRRR